MGAWDDIQEERGTRGGIYLLPADVEPGGSERDPREAHYRVRVTRCIANKDRRGASQFICEMQVLKTTQPKRPVGSHPSTCIQMTRDAAGGNVADICRAGLSSLVNTVIASGGAAALEELCAELEKWGLEVTAGLARDALRNGEPLQADVVHLGKGGKAVEFWIGGEENPLGDVELLVTAYNKHTQEDKDKGKISKPFTRLIWSVPPDVDDAMRAKCAEHDEESPSVRVVPQPASATDDIPY